MSALSPNVKIRSSYGRKEIPVNIQYKENVLTPEDFIRLRIAVGRTATPPAQAEAALRTGLYDITAFCEGTAVAMGRLVGDGAMYWYIQDVAVLPEYQGKGIGKSIVERLLQHVYSCTPNGTFTTVGLMAAQGKEGFYEKLGFQAMPNAGSGAGMTRYIEKNWRNSSSDL